MENAVKGKVTLRTCVRQPNFYDCSLFLDMMSSTFKVESANEKFQQ